MKKNIHILALNIFSLRNVVFSCVVLLLSFFLFSNVAFSLTRYSVASNNWNSTSTWSASSGGASGASAPVAGDVVYIEGHTVTVTADAACASITFQNTSGSILTVNSGFTLAVTGAVTMYNAANANVSASISGAGTLTCASVSIGNGTGATSNTTTRTHTLTSTIAIFTVSGSLTINSYFVATNRIRNGVFNLSGGILTVNGSIATVNANASNTSVFSNSAGSNYLYLGGATPFSITGTGASTITLNGASTTVNYNYGGAQTVRAVAYYNLILSGSGAKTMTGVTTIGNDFSMSGSATATPVITTVGGSINISGTAIMTTGANNVVTGSLTVGTGARLTMGGFSLSIGTTSSITGTVNTVTAATGTKTFTGAVTINSGGIWDLSTTNPATSFGGGITMDGTTFNNGTGAAAFSATQSLLGASNMTFGGTITPAVSTTLTNSNTGIVTVSSTGSIVLTGNYTQGTNSTLNLAAATPIGAGTFDASTNVNTVNYNGAAQTCKVTTYNNLTLSGTLAKTFGTTPTVKGILSLEGTATISIAPTYSGTTYTLQYKTTDTRTSGVEWPATFSGTGGVIIANTAGSITLSALKTFSAGVPLTINSGATLISLAYSNVPSATSVVTINGTFKTANTTGFSGAAGAAISSTNSPTVTLGTSSTIEYTVTTGGQTITGRSDYGNIKLDNTSNTNTADGAITASGTLTTAAGGTLNMVT